MPTFDDFVDAARSCIGTPFQHQGRLKDVGLDCLGLVVWSAKKIGIPEALKYKEIPYGRIPNGQVLKTSLQKHLEEVWDIEKEPYADFVGRFKAGYVLLFAWKKVPQHVAVLANRKGVWYIIHGYSGCKFVTEHRLDEKWLSHVRGIFRFRELT